MSPLITLGDGSLARRTLRKLTRGCGRGSLAFTPVNTIFSLGLFFLQGLSVFFVATTRDLNVCTYVVL